MIELHPEFLTKNGEKQFAVLPYEGFLKIKQLLEDLEDLRDLRDAKEEEKDTVTLSLADVKKMLLS
ncbi:MULTISPECIES: type II toxin-antitoxin system Phd/YefM family antitoxin [unclassified Nodularia (in: cyanobacteria)]|uniref:type II toxin-antitoxin system Phd/YefM family antitoxin n=1 Tax=unclassified Nodularia (in: cyanobacteria) TaxID=2656917 RepID=UPI0018829F19|nr:MULTISPECIES: type II toxin-antitoxin system Phd/YefM family antitoxin [unclassified Nodularia (in: cyanobacteria)]MBE9198797.1 type II toxin-antitoxin system Phd/YefM family antitoxin [Nodularia sp. LEGE 06071]MCC2692951.1 type II toxin-antitoxin system Phd/YefM family antitoxin [Nodularia sp. LEGE 04288]